MIQIKDGLLLSLPINHTLALEVAEVCPVFAAVPTPKENKPDQPEKTPLFVGSWLREATRNPAVHARWRGARPDALVALPCVAANFLVVDCDVKAGVDGVGAFESLVREGGLPAGVVKVKTLSGGLHYVFAQPDGDPRSILCIRSGCLIRGRSNGNLSGAAHGFRNLLFSGCGGWFRRAGTAVAMLKPFPKG